MAVAGGDLLCLSGVAAAAGAAVASLFFRQQPQQQDATQALLMQQQMLAMMIHHQQSASHSGGHLFRHSAPVATNETDAEHAARGASPDEVGMSVGHMQGFSMEDARKRNEEFRENFKEAAPAEVLSQLQRGNARFCTGCAVRPEKSAFERRALIMAQFPTCAVLGCSDSRVPIELIFDQGLGDLFVVRVAGNCLETGTAASLQYAVHHLKVKVLLVMGHEGCGAVKAAGLPLSKIEQEPAELAAALKGMKEGLNEARLKNIHDARAYDREAVVTNVRRQVERLCDDPAIMAKIEAKELIVCGSFYEISSGIVDFFMEVAEIHDHVTSPRVVMRGVSLGVQSRLEYSKSDGPSPTSAGLQMPKTGVVMPPIDSAPVRADGNGESAPVRQRSHTAK